jgi:hypothetical protein
MERSLCGLTVECGLEEMTVILVDHKTPNVWVHRAEAAEGGCSESGCNEGLGVTVEPWRVVKS